MLESDAALLQQEPDRPAPGQRHFEARGAGRLAWKDRSPIVILAGGVGGGKTRTNLEKLHGCMLKWPGARGLILRKTRSSLTNTGLVTWEDEVLPQGSPILKGARRDSRSVYDYPNGSQVVCGGMAQSGDEQARVMSSQYDMAVMIEATEFEEEDLMRLTTRMRHFACERSDGTFVSQILGDCNPSGPNHWIKRLEATGRLKLYESRIEDNPVYWDERRKDWTLKGRMYVDQLEALKPSVMYDRLRLGKWVQAEGVVYPEFDRKIHLIDRFEIPDSWRRVRGIDFGYTNAFVCGWWAIDHDGRMYLYREIYHTQRTVKVHAAQINDLSAGERIAWTVADHDAEDRATLRECKIGTIKAKKDIMRGIQAVRERLKVRGDKKPRLFLMRDSLVKRDEDLWQKKRPCCGLDETDYYVWPKTSEGRPIKEIPVDDNDHFWDQARYVVMALDYQKPPAEPDTPEVVEEKKKAAVVDEEKRRLEHLWNYGWNSF